MASRRVYRLQNLPHHVDRLSATELLARAIGDERVTANDIKVSSLADAIDEFQRWPTKVATVMFTKTPMVLEGAKESWKFHVPGLFQPLVLDCHFHGFTPLNSVIESKHSCDCIVLSGLASHPLGSWQPKGDDKSFMWIRDALPDRLSDIRFILYGYDTTLADSRSFQSVMDLSRTLIGALQANGWASPSTKPLLFLAHSLGGVLLKQVFVALANGDERANFVLNMIKGAVFFGVPSVGMPIPYLLTMVGDQPNKDLVQNLSDQSRYLEKLEAQFAGISYLWGKKRLFWAYETRASPTVEKQANGSFERTGRPSVMVDTESATGGRCTSDPESTIQIDEDHSNMVKFYLGDHRISIIISKICDIYRPGRLEGNVRSLTGLGEASTSVRTEANDYGNHDEHVVPAPSSISLSDKSDITLWDYDLVLDSLRPPERDRRLEQIEGNFGHTFQWAYDDSSIGLAQWLRKGKGIFWVSGKPGSGKSTLMKFLISNHLTTELLHHWQSNSRQVIASFFFHHRGTVLQKSFEGLLRGLLSQLLEAEASLCHVVDDILETKFQERLTSGQHGSLRSDVHHFLSHAAVSRRSDELEEELNRLLLSGDPISQLNLTLKSVFALLKKKNVIILKRALLNQLHSFQASEDVRRDRLSQVMALTLTARTILSKLNAAELDIRPCSAILQECIRTWCERIDLTALIRIFLAQNDVRPQPEVSERYIKDLANRQRARQKIRMQLHQEQWTKRNLEYGLRQVMDQDILDLEICLFFDALDEYDGRPEVISGFLKDLTHGSSSMRTRTRILFSSRPWPVFREEFDACPGFRIHEHTQEDIREFCTSSIPNDPRGRRFLLPMVDEIANRARGVFLWVKLAMRDLSRIATDERIGTEELGLKLRECLDSVPDELEDYYSAIIQRLPLHTRKETYVLLECLSRSNTALHLEELLRLIACGLSPTYHEAERKWAAARASMRTSELDPYLRTISGGLVDVSGANNLMQLMHQTCKEWIQTPTFKVVVLGDQASMAVENGHSFLAKYYAHSSYQRFLYHVQEAERTTGVSQYVYLSTLPDHLYQHLCCYQGSAATLATHCRLFLFLKECLAQKETFLQRASETLLTACYNIRTHEEASKGATESEVIEMARFLLEHGYQMDRDMEGIWKLVGNLWDSQDLETAQQYVDLLAIGVQNCRRPQVLFKYHDFKEHGALTMLHVSPPGLARSLLERGASVNDRTKNRKQTPLDYVLSPASVHQRAKFSPEWIYETAVVLAQHDGRIQSTTQIRWSQFLSKLERCGFDTGPLKAVGVKSLATASPTASPTALPTASDPITLQSTTSVPAKPRKTVFYAVTRPFRRH